MHMKTINSYSITGEVPRQSNAAPLAVVTGATSGIGKTIAASLLREGWEVAVNGYCDDEQARRGLADLRAEGGRIEFAACDVGSKVEVDDFYSWVKDQFGRAPDLLVNNAGVQTWSSLLDLQESDWDRVIQTNLKGCFLNTQAAARLMVQDSQPGAIVNIGSGCNKLAFPKLVDYAASKGGVEMFTKQAAVELGEHSIRVNCVAPGAVLNERTVAEADDYAGSWAQITPLRRVGTEEDIANAVIFLAHEKSSFITGQTLWVDGGAFTKANWPYQ